MRYLLKFLSCLQYSDSRVYASTRRNSGVCDGFTSASVLRAADSRGCFVPNQVIVTLVFASGILLIKAWSSLVKVCRSLLLGQDYLEENRIGRHRLSHHQRVHSLKAYFERPVWIPLNNVRRCTFFSMRKGLRTTQNSISKREDR